VRTRHAVEDTILRNGLALTGSKKSQSRPTLFGRPEWLRSPVNAYGAGVAVAVRVAVAVNVGVNGLPVPMG
jgi:hypothetical protein